jgi:ABC-type phosphate transport system substrate-binding protein
MLKSVIAVLIYLFLASSVVADSSKVEVIVNRQVNIEALALRDLRAIYSMKKRFWQDNQPITVYVLPNDANEHRLFSKKRLNVFPSQLESIWYRQVYTGTGSAPVTLSSIEEMIERVAETPGAIGYLGNENLEKIKNNENIKILNIN